MKRFLAIGAIFATLTLGACGSNDEHQEHNTKTADEVPEIVEVDLTVPENAIAGEEVKISAKVTQGEEIVEDANEVTFEVMNITSGEKEMIKASLSDEKLYTINYTFKTDGTYDITSHVTARDMHTMPTKRVTVTGGKEAASAPSSKDTSAEGQSHGESNHHGQGATIDFKEGTAKVGEAVTLVTNVDVANEPLEGARVQYDISRSDNQHHTWVEAPAKEAGIYQTEFTFTESGIYQIEVHVTKGDELHDHVKQTYTVK